MKKIVNVGFAPANEAETPQVNDLAARLQPSGSGSGSGDESSFGSGSGTIYSKFGGSWRADCEFNWDAYPVYGSYAGTLILKSVHMYVQNVSIVCYGIDAGTTNDGYYFKPFLCSFQMPSKSFYDSSTSEEGITSIEFSARLANQEFNVTKELYDSNGDFVSSTMETEYKNIVVKFKFIVKLDSLSRKIQLESCEVSEPSSN
jgi:hypothetical protein